MRGRRRGLAEWLPALTAILPACAAPSPGPPGEAAAASFEVEYAGCLRVVDGPVCELGVDRSLRLWIRASPEAVPEISFGGQTLIASGQAVGGGRRFGLAIPEPATEVEVRARAPDGEATWTLRLADFERPGWLEEARALAAEGRLADAKAALQHKAAPGEPAADRGWALLQLGRWSLTDMAEAAEPLGEAVAAFRAAGRWHDEIDAATLLAFVDIELRRFAEARQVLEAIELPTDAPAELAFLVAFNRGNLAANVGDSRSALRHLTAAMERAERLGLARFRGMAVQMLALELQRLGRSREAADHFARLRAGPRGGIPCDAADLLSNHAWVQLLALEAGETADDPTPLLEEAEEIYLSEDCGRSDQRVNVQVNLALAHLHAGRPGRARAALERVRELAGDATALHRLWWLDVEGRIALDEGRPEEALRLYRRLEQLGRETFSPEGRWRAAIGRALAREALGEPEAALAAVAEAESLLDGQSLRVPLHEGRETFVARREAGTRLHVDLLLRHGRPGEALEAARRARSRVLRGLSHRDRLAHLAPEDQERWYRDVGEYLRGRAELEAETDDDWGLPGDRLPRAQAERRARQRELDLILDRALAVLGAAEAAALPALRSGDVVLAYHPLPHGWVGFAAGGGELAVHRFEMPEDLPSHSEELAARLLEPFREAIADAERVRILPYGVLRELDFHALPFGGDVLLASRPVVYGLDLAIEGEPAGDGPKRALIVADPRGDLPASRREARAVLRALGTPPAAWSVETLAGDETGIEPVRSALARADLLHYAGHADFDGLGGWESALWLAGRTRLTVGDVLALGSAPSWVVLSGCETGRAATVAPIESIGLAQAFLAAGSRQAVAAVRPVGDRAAAGLFGRFYGGWSGEEDLAVLLREALLAWRRADRGADWASFRVLER